MCVIRLYGGLCFQYDCPLYNLNSGRTMASRFSAGELNEIFKERGCNLTVLKYKTEKPKPVTREDLLSVLKETIEMDERGGTA